MHRLARCSLALLALLALLATGCRDVTQPAVDNSLVGTWYRTQVFLPVTTQDSFYMLLAVTGDSVTGRGRWGNAGGLGGDVVVRGTVSGDAVTLDITFSSDFPTVAVRAPQHFVGTLLPGFAAELRGTLYETDTARSFSFFKELPIG